MSDTDTTPDPDADEAETPDVPVREPADVESVTEVRTEVHSHPTVEDPALDDDGS